MKAAGVLPRRRRPPPQLQPDAIRSAYFGAILGPLERARKLVREHLEAELPGLAETAAAARGDGSQARSDKDPSDINAILDRVSDRWFTEFPNERLAALASRYANRTAAFQREQLSKQFKAVLGIDLYRSEPWLAPRVAAFTAENVALIKSVASDLFTDLEKRLVAGLRNGQRWEELAATIEARYGVAESRARLVARDQVGKLFGELNETRQKAHGITGAIWRTMRDNRVRDSHDAMEGERFKWDAPPTVDGEQIIPGEAINCRCWAEPDFSTLEEDLARPLGAAEPAERDGLSPPAAPPGGGGGGGQSGPPPGGGEGEFPAPRFHGEEPPADGPQPYWRMVLGPPGQLVDLRAAKKASDPTVAAADALRKRGNDVFLLPERHIIAMYDASVNPPGGDTTLNPVELTRIAKRGASARTVKNALEGKHRDRQGADQLVVDATTSGLTRADAVAGVARARKNLKGAFRFIRIMGANYDLTFWMGVRRIEP